MVTFGQKLKDFRKKADLSQFELASKLGVSVQAVSRWECDNGMPDIIKIVPLSKILGVSLEALLDDDFEEENDIPAIGRDTDSVLGIEGGNQVVDIHRCEEMKNIYNKLFETVKRYPYNYRVAYRCASCGIGFLAGVVTKKLIPMTDKQINGIVNDIERMLLGIVSYDSNITRKVDAKLMLVDLYSLAGDYDRAFKQCDDLGGADRIAAEWEIASVKKDRDEEETLVKKLMSERLRSLMSSLRLEGKAYSSCGMYKREKAIEVWKKYADMTFFIEGMIDMIFVYTWRRYAYIYLAKEYVRDDKPEKALDYIEKVADTCIEEYEWIKQQSCGKIGVNQNNFTIVDYNESTILSSVTLEKKKESYPYYLMTCIEDYGDKIGNPIVISERYAKAMQRVQKVV